MPKPKSSLLLDGISWDAFTSDPSNCEALRSFIETERPKLSEIVQRFSLGMSVSAVGIAIRSHPYLRQVWNRRGGRAGRSGFSIDLNLLKRDVLQCKPTTTIASEHGVSTYLINRAIQMMPREYRLRRLQNRPNRPSRNWEVISVFETSVQQAEATPEPTRHLASPRMDDVVGYDAHAIDGGAYSTTDSSSANGPHLLTSGLLSRPLATPASELSTAYIEQYTYGTDTSLMWGQDSATGLQQYYAADPSLLYAGKFAPYDLSTLPLMPDFTVTQSEEPSGVYTAGVQSQSEWHATIVGLEGSANSLNRWEGYMDAPSHDLPEGEMAAQCHTQVSSSPPDDVIGPSNSVYFSLSGTGQGTHASRLTPNGGSSVSDEDHFKAWSPLPMGADYSVTPPEGIERGFEVPPYASAKSGSAPLMTTYRPLPTESFIGALSRESSSEWIDPARVIQSIETPCGRDATPSTIVPLGSSPMLDSPADASQDTEQLDAFQNSQEPELRNGRVCLPELMPFDDFGSDQC